MKTTNDNLQPKKIDGILHNLILTSNDLAFKSFNDGNRGRLQVIESQAIKDEAKQALLEHLLSQPELQEGGHVCKDVDCPRRVDLRTRQEVRAMLTRELGVDNGEVDDDPTKVDTLPEPEHQKSEAMNMDIPKPVKNLIAESLMEVHDAGQFGTKIDDHSGLIVEKRHDIERAIEALVAERERLVYMNGRADAVQDFKDSLTTYTDQRLIELRHPQEAND